MYSNSNSVCPPRRSHAQSKKVKGHMYKPAGRIPVDIIVRSVYLETAIRLERKKWLLQFLHGE